MSHPELENYLGHLEKALGTISVSEKAEIITEIKSHVLEALDNDAHANVHSVLTALGEPEQVANRYLLERGLKPQKPPRRSMIKWLTIGFLGTFGIIVFAVVAIIWRFTPLISVDEENGRVQILGGMIDVNESSSSIQIDYNDDEGTVRFKPWRKELSGKKEIGSKISEIAVSFSNGKFDIENSNSSEFTYDCKIIGHGDNITIEEVDQKLLVKLDDFGGSKCHLKIPREKHFAVRGNNGKVSLEKLKNPMAVDITNGKIDFQPADKTDYRFDASVTNGKMDSFISSQNPKAYAVKLHLVNGKIAVER